MWVRADGVAVAEAVRHPDAPLSNEIRRADAAARDGSAPLPGRVVHRIRVRSTGTVRAPA